MSTGTVNYITEKLTITGSVTDYDVKANSTKGLFTNYQAREVLLIADKDITFKVNSTTDGVMFLPADAGYAEDVASITNIYVTTTATTNIYVRTKQHNYPS